MAGADGSPDAVNTTDPAYRTHNRARRLGYQLLPGETFSYLLHLRPREWPIMAAHTALGYFLAVGVTLPFRAEYFGHFVVTLAVWVVCLNGGTLAINSAFDRDIGDVGYLDAPPPPPGALAWVGLGLMALGQIVALRLEPPGFVIAYAICFAMSLLYSVPPVRLKAVAGADWIINMIGFGTLTPYAGWAATERPLDLVHALVLFAFCPLFAALYPLTQIYQFEEDRARGDRTLALMLGMRASLSIAVLASGVAFAIFAVAAMLAGVTLERGGLLLIAGVVWLGLLTRWSARCAQMTREEHKRGMYLALGAWGLTDLAVLVAFGAG